MQTENPTEHKEVVKPKIRVLLTSRVECEGVVDGIVKQEEVRGDAELSALVIVIAMGRDDGVQLHLEVGGHTVSCSNTQWHKACVCVRVCVPS